MILVGSTHFTLMLAALRTIIAEVYIDWNDDGSVSNESFYLDNLTIEQSFEEPLASFAQAQADVVLINVNDRYTPTT